MSKSIGTTRDISIPIGNGAPKRFNVVVEIPKGGHNKYEFSEELGAIKLDRVLHSPLFYPVEYGFIPETRGDDGDHLDAMVLVETPTFPGCIIEARPIAALHIIDGGKGDEKVLCVPVRSPYHERIIGVDDLIPHTLDEISHFFEEYKKLEKKTIVVKQWVGKKEALDIIRIARELYRKEKGKRLG